MFIECCFSKGILSMCDEIVDIRGELITQLNEGSWASEYILDEIKEQYGEFDGNINFDEYLSVDEESIRLDRDTDEDYFLTFAVDCEFDIERFAQDNGLVVREGVEEEADEREDR